MVQAKKPQILAVVGPTASGKTGLAIRLAKAFSGEIISADSRQVYRELDIGTAKVTAAEMQGIPHHLIDILSLPNTYTAQDFVKDASQTITAINDRHHLPIIAGGTFFYLDLLLKKTTAAPVPPDPILREKLNGYTAAELYAQLKNTDPTRAQTIDAKNSRRLIRALEIAHAMGKNPPITVTENPYHALIIGINCDRDELRAQYQLRASDWLNAGIVEETQKLLETSITRERIKELGFEYTLTLQLIDKQITSDEWKERFIQKNWQYAKRQLTWLKRDPTIHWYTPDQEKDICADVAAFLNSSTLSQ